MVRMLLLYYLLYAATACCIKMRAISTHKYSDRIRSTLHEESEHIIISCNYTC
jgi:hypothetical protein